MEHLRSYLLSVTAAAIGSAIICQISGTKSSTGTIMKILTGVFMIITLFSPLVSFRFNDIEQIIRDFSISSNYASQSGMEMATEEISNIIKKQTEAYILDEANKMGIEMSVEVTLSDSNPPQPCFVILRGSVSPYQKKDLSQYIAENLGIIQENQQWI